MSTPASAKPHIPYKVGTPEKTQTFEGAGGLKTVWHVPFEAPNGTHAYVDVPDNLFTAAYVDQLIETELERIMGVHALGPQPHPDNLAG